MADQGFPIVGQGDFGDYFFSSLTKDLWRLSLGLGYRFSENLLLKAEYSFERGKEVGGDIRNQEDMFSVQAALKF
jgi:opacity protein-like surface antigen